VCVCVCVCVCMCYAQDSLLCPVDIHACVLSYVYVHTIQTDRHTCNMHSCKRACMHACMHTNASVHRYMCICMYGTYADRLCRASTHTHIKGCQVMCINQLSLLPRTHLPPSRSHAIPFTLVSSNQSVPTESAPRKKRSRKATAASMHHCAALLLRPARVRVWVRTHASGISAAHLSLRIFSARC
jgi:hypothetical protein